MDFRKDGRGSTSFIRKSAALPEALHEFNASVVEVGLTKTYNPLYRILRKLTGKKTFTKYQQTLTDNGTRIRKAIHTYVEQRKSGERKS